MDNEEYIMKKLENLDERVRNIEINFATLTGKLIAVVTIAAGFGHFAVSALAKFLGGD